MLAVKETPNTKVFREQKTRKTAEETGKGSHLIEPNLYMEARNTYGQTYVEQRRAHSTTTEAARNN